MSDKKLAQMIREIPGMQEVVAGRLQMTNTGQSVLATALILPKKKAVNLIKWIRKEVELSQELDAKLARLKRQDLNRVKLAGAARRVRSY